MELYVQGILADHSKELSLLTFNVAKNGLVDDQAFVEKMVVFSELVGKLKPKYILFDKSEIDFEISPRLHKFAGRNVIGEILNYGVKKIFFLTTPQRYERYLNDQQKPPYIIPCPHFQQVLDAIAADKTPAG